VNRDRPKRPEVDVRDDTTVALRDRLGKGPDPAIKARIEAALAHAKP
jgi:hypothetical protein